MLRLDANAFTEDDELDRDSDLTWLAKRILAVAARLGLPITTLADVRKYVGLRRDGSLPADWRIPEL